MSIIFFHLRTNGKKDSVRPTKKLSREQSTLKHCNTHCNVHCSTYFGHQFSFVYFPKKNSSGSTNRWARVDRGEVVTLQPWNDFKGRVWIGRCQPCMYILSRSTSACMYMHVFILEWLCLQITLRAESELGAVSYVWMSWAEVLMRVFVCMYVWYIYMLYYVYMHVCTIKRLCSQMTLSAEYTLFVYLE